MKKILEGLKNPSKALRWVRSNLEIWLYFRDFNDIDYEDEDSIIRQIEELKSDIRMELSDAGYEPGLIATDSAVDLYYLIKETEPEIVVETGVCNGLSTAVILKALDQNEKGKLYSVDLPTYSNMSKKEAHAEAAIPVGKDPGWIVSDDLSERWELKKGNSLYETPSLLRDLNQVDIFMHDSDHSYEVMMFEFCLAWKHLSENGFIISDDVTWNNAFEDFFSAVAGGCNKYKLGGNIGVIEKSN